MISEGLAMFKTSTPGFFEALCRPTIRFQFWHF
jgi:hypothetical protein